MSYPSDTDCRNCGNTPCDCADKLLAIAQERERQKLTRFVWPVLVEVGDERTRQHLKWGEQNHPDGTGVHEGQIEAAIVDRKVCQDAFAAGEGTYCDILREEVSEAFAESDPAKLRAELVQVAAVAVAWIEKIDRDIAKAAR